MFEIKWEGDALNFLKKLGLFISKRIIKKVERLKINPYSGDIKRLKGSDNFRLRIGDYRVIFDVVGNFIRILKIGPRKNIYKK